MLPKVVSVPFASHTSLQFLLSVMIYFLFIFLTIQRNVNSEVISHLFMEVQNSVRNVFVDLCTYLVQILK